MSPPLHVDRWDPVLGQIHDTEVHLRLLRQTEATAELRRGDDAPGQGTACVISQNLVEAQRVEEKGDKARR